MHDNIIEINNLTLPYAFKEFSITFSKNKLSIVSGPNNCGKTTLIRTLDGQIKTKNNIFLGTVGLEHYQITDIALKVKTIIPDEYYFYTKTVEQEVATTLNKRFSNIKKTTIKETLKQSKLTKYQKSNPNSLDYFHRLKLALCLALIQRPELLLLDNILAKLTPSEKTEIMTYLNTYREENKISIIMTCSNLDDSLYGDYLYVIKDSQIILEGKPLEVLENDNIINKVGLELPFMIDLSVKLRDYELLTTIETDMDRMVNILWK
ncbi:MAG: energy-coupling factor ABC transporter ATP-binding protein [Tenericutes bacterium]|nr:energy-coupling factor ABC transporter ATP-binding protein [Mycoplasmatota bacterium]